MCPAFPNILLEVSYRKCIHVYIFSFKYPAQKRKSTKTWLSSPGCEINKAGPVLVSNTLMPFENCFREYFSKLRLCYNFTSFFFPNYRPRLNSSLIKETSFLKISFLEVNRNVAHVKIARSSACTYKSVRCEYKFQDSYCNIKQLKLHLH